MILKLKSMSPSCCWDITELPSTKPPTPLKLQAELATTQMALLSFNRLNSYRTHMLPISSIAMVNMAQSKAEIEAIDSALR